MSKSGLVMEGGAMRGIFTCGVIDVFMENGITFDGALRYNKKYGHDWRYCSIRSLIKTGDLYGADFCYRELINDLDPFDREAFRTNTMAFYVAATDVKTGRAVYHQCIEGDDRDITWI